MALVLPVRGQADWDIANNNALIYLQSAINVASSQINGVTVSGTPNVDDVIKATSSVTAHWAPGGGAVGALLAANNLSDLQSAPTARTNLGLGTAATASSSAFDAAGAATTAQTNAGSYTDAQIASEVTRANAAYLVKASNLADLTNAATARTNLGLGTAATQASSAFDAAGAATTAQANAIADAITKYMPLRADIFDVTKYGAKGDGQFIIDGAITSGQADLTSTSGKFVSGDVGKYVLIKGAANSTVTSLVAQIITFVNSNHVVINTNAVTTVTNALVLWATNDTVAIQTAINAAMVYAAAHGTATVFFPTGSGYFYGIAGPLDTTHSGNSQLYLAPVVTTANKSNLIFLGVGNGSVLQHWLQKTPQLSGSTLVSFGLYANSTVQNSDITAHGNACVIGGPAQPSGYGTSSLLFSNMGVTFKDVSILVPHSMGGLSYSAGDMSGVSNCCLFDFAYGTAGVVPDGDYVNPNLFAAGLSIGWLMPANGNNDLCTVRNVTCHGGFVFAFFMTEHAVIDSMRILYSWSALCPISTYFGSVGASHAMWVNQLSAEGCVNEVNIFGAGVSGIGPFLNIDQLDTEHSNITFTDRNSGTALAAALGTVRLVGLYTPSNVTVTAPTGLKIIDGQRAYPSKTVTANYNVSVIDETIYADATAGAININLTSAQWTPNTYTIVKTDSSANHVNVIAQGGQTIIGTIGLGTGTAALTSQYQKIKVAPQGGINTNWYEVL